VAQGCLRSYLIDDKGKEHILLFAPEDWWLSDTDSLMNNTPSAYFADAIEDSVVLLADLAAFKQLDAHLPAFAQLYRDGLQKRTEANNRRIGAALSNTAEERYLDFLKIYRTIAQRVPQHMLASYLGITPETLSRVRKRLAQK
jgi:CRP-like cAMP-binding protein